MKIVKIFCPVILDFTSVTLKPGTWYLGPANGPFVIAEDFLTQRYLCPPDSDIPMAIYRIIKVDDTEITLKSVGD